MKTTVQKTMLALGLASALGAHATDTAGQNFQVQVTVLPTCRMTTATVASDASGNSDINFGSVDADATGLAKGNNGSSGAGIKVTCSNTTPYAVKLTPSNSNTTGAGVVTGQSTAANPQQTIAYQLRQATGAAASVWGNTATSGTSLGNSVGGTGTGSAQEIQAFATIASIGGVAPGVYKDTVTVAVTY